MSVPFVLRYLYLCSLPNFVITSVTQSKLCHACESRFVYVQIGQILISLEIWNEIVVFNGKKNSSGWIEVQLYILRILHRNDTRIGPIFEIWLILLWAIKIVWKADLTQPLLFGKPPETLSNQNSARYGWSICKRLHRIGSVTFHRARELIQT